MTRKRKMDPAIRAALDKIRAGLPEGATDTDAISFAVGATAAVLRGDATFVTKADYLDDLLTFARHVLASHLGAEVEAAALDDGRIVFMSGGEVVVAPTPTPAGGDRDTLH